MIGDRSLFLGLLVVGLRNVRTRHIPIAAVGCPEVRRFFLAQLMRRLIQGPQYGVVVIIEFKSHGTSPSAVGYVQ